MIKKLTEKDIKELKYQCRMGYIIPFMIFVIGAFLFTAIYELNFNSKSSSLNSEADLLIIFGFIALSFFIAYKMNHKYFSDITLNPQASFTAKLDSPSLLSMLKKTYSSYLVICLRCFFMRYTNTDALSSFSQQTYLRI